MLGDDAVAQVLKKVIITMSILDKYLPYTKHIPAVADTQRGQHCSHGRTRRQERDTQYEVAAKKKEINLKLMVIFQSSK